MVLQQRIAMAIGDAGGIGPELAARVLADPQANSHDLIVFGDKRLLELGAVHAGVELDLPVIAPSRLPYLPETGSVVVDLENLDPKDAPLGQSSASGGRAALENFAAALLAADAGAADCVFFTPFNKYAMRLARADYVDEIGFIDATIDASESGREFNVLDEVWNARVTSHVPLKDVADLLTEERIYHGMKLTAEVMEGAGFQRPRIGVAAFNPHAGDGRNFGDEDEDIILPAVLRAQKEQLAVTGPVPADTVFVRAVRGEFDAVLTMFHDQGQIAMKLLGFDRGVTLIANYPFPIVTPAHGTAYDIAGQGKADTGATFNAVNLGRKLMALHPRTRDDDKLAALPGRIERLSRKTAAA